VKNFLYALEEYGEKILFLSRWVLAPLYLGLVISLFALVIIFFGELQKMIIEVFHGAGPKVITLTILELVDIVLLSNLILIVTLSGYENFVSHLEAADDSRDKFNWMGTIDYGGLKLKVIGSIVAISVIQLLRVFMEIDKISDRDVLWLVALHGVFVISGLMFSLTELIQKYSEKVEKSMNKDSKVNYSENLNK